jgi:hypothetical protein
VDKLFSLHKTKFEIRRTEAFGGKNGECRIKEQQMDLALVFLVPIPDIKEYNMYGDDLFYTKQFLDIIFKSLYNRKTNLYLISENTIGLEPMVKDGPYRKFRQKIRPIHRSLSYFGMLGNEMHRAVRLVVDTGIHSKGWTREQAIQFSMGKRKRSRNNN